MQIGVRRVKIGAVSEVEAEVVVVVQEVEIKGWQLEVLRKRINFRTLLED